MRLASLQGTHVLVMHAVICHMRVIHKEFAAALACLRLCMASCEGWHGCIFTYPEHASHSWVLMQVESRKHDYCLRSDQGPDALILAMQPALCMLSVGPLACMHTMHALHTCAVALSQHPP